MSETPALPLKTLEGKPVRASCRPRAGCPGIRRADGLCHRRHGVPSFLHHRLGRRRSGSARRRLDHGLSISMSVLPNPDTWTIGNGIPVTLSRATEELRKYRHGLKVMSDGFTLSGGEPLLQDRFAVKVFSAAKAMGIHTALDTNGSLGERLTDGEFEAIDLVLLDIKTWGPERHGRLTGMEVGPVLDFARRLAARRRPVWVRLVLVPGLTDDAENIARIARFMADFGERRASRRPARRDSGHYRPRRELARLKRPFRRALFTPDQRSPGPRRGLRDSPHARHRARG